MTNDLQMKFNLTGAHHKLAFSDCLERLVIGKEKMFLLRNLSVCTYNHADALQANNVNHQAPLIRKKIQDVLRNASDRNGGRLSRGGDKERRVVTISDSPDDDDD